MDIFCNCKCCKNCWKEIWLNLLKQEIRSENAYQPCVFHTILSRFSRVPFHAVFVCMLERRRVVARPNRVVGLSRSTPLSAGINLISSSLQTNPPLCGLNMKWRLLICSQKSARLQFYLSLPAHWFYLCLSLRAVRSKFILSCSWNNSGSCFVLFLVT